ncbi:hypothetical protein Cgig2_018442 [Carnegiea gigantea]|uniref:Actin-related protein 8 n=1 Tax=Carnegiea gigantea TaxID=171969 RepID=A0A9Q1JLM4_9CARY|nr:hypothetical protein Cgig2_018442 [Carnegiea gigantea]
MDNIITWNVRGMNSPNKLKDVRFFCCSNKAGLVGLVETTVRQVNFAKVAQSFQDIEGNPSAPWVVMGDFNHLSDIDDRIGGLPATQARIMDFQYAWTNKQEYGSHVFSKLDRILVNSSWTGLFLNVEALFLADDALYCMSGPSKYFKMPILVIIPSNTLICGRLTLITQILSEEFGKSQFKEYKSDQLAKFAFGFDPEFRKQQDSLMHNKKGLNQRVYLVVQLKFKREVYWAGAQKFRMQVRPTGQPIVVSIPICHNDDNESAKASRRQLKEAIYSALFDMNVPAVCAISQISIHAANHALYDLGREVVGAWQATLALYAARRTSGIVVNIGFYQTSIVPILHGKIKRKVGVEVVGMGALKLTGFLREQMQQQNMYFESLYTVRELKENLCYVAYDYEAELSKDTQASCEVSREGVFTLSKERFQTGEILFQPRIAGVCAMGLHQAVALCMDHCHAAELMGDDSWFKTVVLSGGTASLPGLAERLEKELHGLLPPYMSSGIKVIPPPHGVDSAWHGARLISNLSSFPGAWCIRKKQFRQKSRSNRGGLW